MISIAIIGAGATGATLAIHLSRILPAEASIALIGDAPAGSGLAYGAANPEHLLNVFAGGMSLDPERPGDFVDWLLPRKYPGDEREAVAQRFVPRLWFGEYAGDRLAEVVAGGPERSMVKVIRDRAVRLLPEDERWRVDLAGGREIVAGQVALCLGSFPGRLPLPAGRIAPEIASRLIHNPWSDGRLREIGPEDDVLVLGTGLTLVDLVLTREARGDAGRTIALSRRGMLPGTHLSPRPTPIPIEGVQGGVSLSDLVRTVRAAASDERWRQVVDGLRPHTQAIWSGWSDAERRRFQRLLASHWGSVRHRMAPEVAAVICRAIAAGRLEIVAGRLARLDVASDGRILAEIRRRDWETVITQVDWTINCTGPERDLRRQDDPLLQGLFASGVARIDALHLGLDTDGAEHVIAAGGMAWPGLYALGPITMGRLWEINAIPDIRVQAARVAAEMAGRVEAPAVAHPSPNHPTIHHPTTQ